MVLVVFTYKRQNKNDKTRSETSFESCGHYCSSLWHLSFFWHFLGSCMVFGVAANQERTTVATRPRFTPYCRATGLECRPWHPYFGWDVLLYPEERAFRLQSLLRGPQPLPYEWQRAVAIAAFRLGRGTLLSVRACSRLYCYTWYSCESKLAEQLEQLLRQASQLLEVPPSPATHLEDGGRDPVPERGDTSLGGGGTWL